MANLLPLLYYMPMNNDPCSQDTIAAVSTPIGEGAIGIVRLSGPDALAIARKLFDRPLEDRRLVHGHIVDPSNGAVADEVLVAFMAAPHTYTREDTIEINCHGGPLPLQRILELALRYGARAANPGEFTLRAFLNGRIDLSQAEAVLDVIQARTEASLRVAERGLAGGLSQQVKAVRATLMEALSYLMARIDFPEDEVEAQNILPQLGRARESLRAIHERADAGIVYRQGVRTAIVGRPNVGKSSLLNRLLRVNRAIVTPVSGTTRDTLEEVVNLQGVPFLLVDTAGIAETRDAVERVGVERSRRAIGAADFVLFIIDVAQPLMDADREIAALLSGKSVTLVANKSDLPQQADLSQLEWSPMMTSALNGDGIEELEAEMVRRVLAGDVTAADTALVSNPRHKEALGRALEHLDGALGAFRASLPDDFVTIDLTACLEALGEITGETVTEELLQNIFSRFCIGK